MTHGKLNKEIRKRTSKINHVGYKIVNRFENIENNNKKHLIWYYPRPFFFFKNRVAFVKALLNEARFLRQPIPPTGRHWDTKQASTLMVAGIVPINTRGLV